MIARLQIEDKVSVLREWGVPLHLGFTENLMLFAFKLGQGKFVYIPISPLCEYATIIYIKMFTSDFRISVHFVHKFSRLFIARTNQSVTFEGLSYREPHDPWAPLDHPLRVVVLPWTLPCHSEIRPGRCGSLPGRSETRRCRDQKSHLGRSSLGNFVGNFPIVGSDRTRVPPASGWHPVVRIRPADTSGCRSLAAAVLSSPWRPSRCWTGSGTGPARQIPLCQSPLPVDWYLC